MIISQKKDGAMHFQENVISFCKKLNFSYTDLITCKQIHGKNVIRVFEKDKGKPFKGADGLLTTSRKIILGVMLSDCIPISFYSKNLCGILHAGWRGISKGIIENGITEIEKAGESPSNFNFEIGPGIGSCHFKVKEDVPRDFLKNGAIESVEPYLRKKNNDLFFDLKKIAEEKIRKSGASNIKVSPICTYCDKGYFSFRRDKQLNNMIALIRL